MLLVEARGGPGLVKKIACERTRRSHRSAENKSMLDFPAPDKTEHRASGKSLRQEHLWLMKAPSTKAAVASDMRNGLSKAQASRVHPKGHSFGMRASRPQAGRIETRNPEAPEQSCVSHMVHK